MPVFENTAPLRTGGSVWGPFVASLAFHAAILSSFPLVLSSESTASPPEREKIQRIRFVEPPMNSLSANPLLDRMDGQLVDIMDNRASEAKTPKDARFLSDKNRNVDRETQARITDANPNSPVGGGEDQASAGSAGRERTSAGKEVARYGTTQAAPGEQGKLKLELSDSFLKEHAAGPSVASRAPTNYLPEISMGDETLLNTREYVYASFFIRMKRQMENVWDPRNVLSRETRAREQYVTTVGITLRKDGYLESVRILGSSGNPALDREAVRAVRAGAPYLNPPPALVEANGRIVIPSWHFIVTNYARF